MNNIEKKQSKSSNNFFILALVILIAVILLSPILIAVFVTRDWVLTDILSKSDGNSNVWIGFWGSYLGGALGTIGVIFVAYFQSGLQRELNEQSMDEQRNLNQDQIDSQIDSLHKVEKFNRERLRMETQIRIIEDYIETLKDLQDDLYFMRFGLIELIGSDNLRKIYQTEEHKHVVKSTDSLKKSSVDAESKYLEIKNKFSEYNGSYFAIRFEDVFYRNIVLDHKDIEMEMPNSSFSHNIDKIVKKVNSKFKELDVDELVNDYADDSGKFPDVEQAWKWVRDEKANAYRSMSKLIDKLN